MQGTCDPIQPNKKEQDASIPDSSASSEPKLFTSISVSKDDSLVVDDLSSLGPLGCVMVAYANMPA